ncbi:hypothetical protein O6H91_Y285600 [Diphasiastrum complanatum]|nr:hypothetical protein O6H91_Y285600 [Diphasiastrum complanatum]
MWNFSTSYSCSYFLNLHKATGHPAMMYMSAGRLANDIEHLSDEVATSFAVLQLKRILPNATELVSCIYSHQTSSISVSLQT